MPVADPYENGVEPSDVTWTYLTLVPPLATQETALGFCYVCGESYDITYWGTKCCQLGILRQKFTVTPARLFGFETRCCVQLK
jgi:hypothetical protein